MPTDFDNRLAEIFDSSSEDSRYKTAYDDVARIVKSIRRRMNQGLREDPIAIEIEPGFQSTMGRQLNVVLKIERKHFRTTLFRAYVPDDGFPIQLDLFGEDAVVCGDKRELEEELLKFLDKTRDGIMSFREYALQS
jgi:hypothetical protein